MLLVLAACNLQQPAASSAPVTLAGVVGGTDAAPTLAGQTLDLSSASVSVNGSPAQTTERPGMFVYAEGASQGGRVVVRSVDV